MQLWRFIDHNHAAMTRLIGESGLDCSFRQEGGLRLAETESELAELSASSRLMQQHRIGHQMLDAAGVTQRLPWSRGFVGGLFLAREAIFDPARFVRELAARARAHGVAIREQCPVTGIDGALGDFTVMTEHGQRVRASMIVHATSALAPALDRSGFLRRLVFPFRGQILVTNDLPDEIAASMPHYAMSSNFCYEYFRMHGRRMTVGGMRWSVKGEESGTTDDGTVNATVGGNLRAWLARRFPAIAAAGVSGEWTGIMAGTPDGLPLCGELPGRPGELACLAFNGYGMSLAFLAGRALAEMVTEGKTGVEGAGLFRPDRLQS
jgi:glycine oxidase